MFFARKSRAVLDKTGKVGYNSNVRRRSLVVKPQLPKLEMRVRFPSPAPTEKAPERGLFPLEQAHQNATRFARLNAA